jgi:His-Xaa-Ser system radical SAM maturase HxsC
MIRLHGRTTATALTRDLHPDVWQVARDDEAPSELPLACLLSDPARVPPGHRLYLTTTDIDHPVGPTIKLPTELAHISPGDVVSVASDGSRLAVMWKNTATHNSVLLTEQCDNYCLMCSQPPKARDDSWLYARAKRVISLLPSTAYSLGLTGGEPTLNTDALLDLLEHCRIVAPSLQLHLLSNGRRFSEPEFTRRYADIGNNDIMVGIPLYAAEPGLHDYVVQAHGAFSETVRGILNLGALGQRIEIRVVVQRHTVPVLGEIARYIARNLPFVEQVALMGLEMVGLARPNSAEVWIDPVDYQAELHEATRTLIDARITTKIYNHQLCVLDRRLWPFAVQSISDWKNDYLEDCSQCAGRDACGGVFTTSGNRVSQHLKPFTLSGWQALTVNQDEHVYG